MSASDKSLPLTDMGWGPGCGPWTYRKLSGPSLDVELARLAFVKRIHQIDCVVGRCHNANF